MGRKLYVRNLPYSATEQTLRAAFSGIPQGRGGVTASPSDNTVAAGETPLTQEAS